MRFTRDSKISDVEEANLSTEEAQTLFATEYDVTIQSLVSALSSLGMSDEMYQSVLDEAKSRLQEALVVSRHRLEHSGGDDMTVAEIEPLTMASDLILAGLLTHVLFLNRDEYMPIMEADIAKGFRA